MECGEMSFWIVYASSHGSQSKQDNSSTDFKTKMDPEQEEEFETLIKSFVTK